MWTYEKKLQYPVKIKTPNPALASMIISQVGGPDGELAASMRYLHQRYSMPYGDVAGILTDVGSEELAHLEMVTFSYASCRLHFLSPLPFRPAGVSSLPLHSR